MFKFKFMKAKREVTPHINIHIVTGARRSGKSTRLWQLACEMKPHTTVVFDEGPNRQANLDQALQVTSLNYRQIAEYGVRGAFQSYIDRVDAFKLIGRRVETFNILIATTPDNVFKTIHDVNMQLLTSRNMMPIKLIVHNLNVDPIGDR